MTLTHHYTSLSPTSPSPLTLPTSLTPSPPYHGLDILQLVKQHQFHNNESVIIGPHIAHIVVQLVGNMAELRELVSLRNEATCVLRVRTVPYKLM